MNSLKDARSYQNLAEYIKATCAQFSEKNAYHCLGKTFSFAQINLQSDNLAKWLQHHSGLQAGDRIAVQLPNLNQYPLVVFAAVKAGLVVVNINPLFTPREVLHQLNDSGAKASFLLADLTAKLQEIFPQTGVKTIITTTAADDLTAEAQNIDSHEETDESGITTIALTEAVRRGAELADLEASSAGQDDILLLQYTGGTTGLPKAACLTHGNILSNASQIHERFLVRCEVGKEIFLCPLPLYHIFAFTMNIVSMFGLGFASVLIPNPRDLDAFVKQIEPFPFSGMCGINTLFVGLCNHEGFKKLDFSHLKVIISGGAALTASTAELWNKTTGAVLSEGYGLSETSPVVTLNVFGEEELGTIGSPVTGTEVQIWDKDGNPLPDGEEGELVCKGPQVMKGYWNKPEETAKAIINGFFRTGDVAKIMPSGNVKIVDRLKDLIIVSGFNVYPNEVENVLTGHKNIIEAAVVGKPDDKTGEAVCAYITVNEKVNTDDIVEYCRQELTPYKVPKKIVVLDELPKSTVGKILRRELRD